MLQESLFDVTEYEESDTEHTPLTHLTFLDTQCLGKTSTTQFFQNKLIQNWISSTIKTNISALVVWVLSRIIFLLILVTFNVRQTSFEEETFYPGRNKWINYTNASLNTEAFKAKSQLSSCLMADYHVSVFDYVCAGYILFSCISGLVVVIYQMQRHTLRWFTYSPTLCYPHRRKNLVLGHSLFYMFNSLLISTGAITLTLSKLIRLQCNIYVPFLVDDIAYFNVLISSAIEMVSLCQVLPKVGSFPMIINRLFGDLWSFLLILVIFASTFVMPMHNIVNRGQKECTFGFTSYFDSYYSMFLAMNNMLDIQKLANTLQTNESTFTLYSFHYLYVFFINILMLNFLIALFSHSVAKTMQYENILVPLNNLNIMFLLEKSMRGFLGCWLEIVKRKCFTYRDNRLFVTSVTVEAPSQMQLDLEMSSPPGNQCNTV